MTRQELYDLVWSRPMTHIAKDFGMSAMDGPKSVE